MAYMNDAGEFPLYLGDVQLVKKGFKIGDELPTGWVEVVETEPPAPLADDYIIEYGAPEEVDGVWRTTYTQRQMTAEEYAVAFAHITLKDKLTAMGLSEAEIRALRNGVIG